jgi:hypothetical protein
MKRVGFITEMRSWSVHAAHVSYAAPQRRLNRWHETAREGRRERFSMDDRQQALALIAACLTLVAVLVVLSIVLGTVH